MSSAGLGAVLLFLPLFSWASGPEGLEIRADPRVELFAALHALSAAPGETDGFRWNQTPYSASLRRRVEPLRSHAAVSLYRRSYERAVRRGWGYMGVLNAVLPCLDESLTALPGEDCAKSDLAREASAFAGKSGLRIFFERNKDLASYESRMEAQRSGLDPLGVFEAYTGLKAVARQRVSPSPLFLPGQVWNRLGEATAPGPALILTVFSPRFRGAEAEFEFLPLVWDVWHEQGHVLLDAELDVYPERVEGLRSRLEPLAASCYQSWRQCLREHMAQGLARGVGRWAADTGRLAAPPPPFKESLPHLPAVAERLREFEEKRSSYSSVRAFYPRLMDLFEALPPSTAAAPGATARGERGRRLKDAGLASFQDGRLAEALDSFAAAAKADPGDSEAHLNRGVVLVELGRLEEALKSLDEAVRAARASGERSGALLADALSSRASLKCRLGRFSPAREDSEEALKAAPEDWARREEVRVFLKALPP
jgi:tetratricopeptide (TPR) repeat protein